MANFVIGPVDETTSAEFVAAIVATGGVTGAVTGDLTGDFTIDGTSSVPAATLLNVAGRLAVTGSLYSDGSAGLDFSGTATGATLTFLNGILVARSY